MKMEPILAPGAARHNGQFGREERGVCLALAAIIVGQIFLVFAKGFNWDEFLHFGQIYDLREGRLFWALQTFHARVFSWVPDLTPDIIAQMRITRICMLGFELVAIGSIAVIARHLTDLRTALLAALVYAASGAVFVHGFSFRADPIITALLMASLAILVTRSLSVKTLIAAGVLIGLAGTFSIKSILYLPCFAGAALYRLSKEGIFDWRGMLRLLVVPIIAVCEMAILLAWHQSGTMESATIASGTSSRASSFLGSGFFLNRHYVLQNLLFAPVLSASVVTALVLLRRHNRPELYLYLGLVLPVLSLVFYRNTYPYFFVFLFAPLAVFAGPGLRAIRFRYGWKKVALVAAIAPAVMLALQPYWLVQNQRSQIDEIHRLFPTPVQYLSYSNYVPDYPRVVPNLISGIGLAKYRTLSIPPIAAGVNAGEVAFVLADSPILLSALRGEYLANTLHDDDFAAISKNYIHYAGRIWLSGKEVCPADGLRQINIVRSGPYTVDGGTIFLDGRQVGTRTTLRLQAGSYTVQNKGQSCVRLWNLPKVPFVPADFSSGRTRAGF